jgi:hypothetical protein
MVVRRGGAMALLKSEKGAEMHDGLTQLEVVRLHREELLEEVESARVASEARRGRRAANMEWRISLGGWILQLRRIQEEYGASPVPKG